MRMEVYELPDAFIRRIRIEGECWIWEGARHPLGYGMVYYRGRNDYAHRVVYRLSGRRIRARRQLHHLCGVRSCVNPDHLKAVTGSQHSRHDGNAAKTHCKYGHEFTPENTYHWRNERRCRECGRQRYYAWRYGRKR